MKLKVLLTVTGGIAAYKSLNVITGLKANGYEVFGMATQKAFDYVAKPAFKVACDYVYEDLRDEPIHITATDENNLSAFIIVPATANIIGKIVSGIADDLITSTILAIPADVPKVICPAMNTRMWHNTVVQRNLQNIRNLGWYIINPVEGKLACGTTGIGKLDKPRNIVKKFLAIMKGGKMNVELIKKIEKLKKELQEVKAEHYDLIKINERLRKKLLEPDVQG